MGSRRINIVGNNYGKLLVVAYSHTDKHKRAIWKCKCACGNTIKVPGNTLRMKQSKSCGCIGVARAAALGHSNKTHGEGDHSTPEYRAWRNMQTRCYNPNTHNFSCYGGRGISVCVRWLNSYEAFLEDMGRRPSDNYSIDRIDVDGNYGPDNCRWATGKQQANNRRNNVNA